MPSSPQLLTMRARLVGAASLMLLTAAAIWGSNSVAGKLAVGEVSPMVLTAARWWIAAFILIPLSWRHVRRDWPRLRSRLAYLAVMGAVGYTAFNWAMYIALWSTTAINVAIAQAAMPMVIFVINLIVFADRASANQTFGYALTLIGVVTVAAAGDIAVLRTLAFNHGDLIMMIAVVFYAIYSAGLRLKPHVHWLSFLTCLVVVAAFWSLPGIVWEMGQGSLIWPSTPLAWGVVVFTALLPSIIAQAAFIRGVELIGANAASIFVNMVPIFGALFAVLILGEAFHLYHAVALILVIGGIMLARR